MPIKILVLCQRKKGRCSASTANVERTIIPNIEKYVSNYLHTTDYKIEYLSHLDTPNPGDEVDFNIEIGDNAEFNNFLASKSQYYSIIVLNTCPYRFINFDYISQMLCNNGVVILSKVNCADKYNTDLFIIPPTDNAISPSNILTYFEYKDGFYIKTAATEPLLRKNPKKNNRVKFAESTNSDTGMRTRSQTKTTKGGKTRNKRRSCKRKTCKKRK